MDLPSGYYESESAPFSRHAIEIKNLGVCLRKIDILTEVNCSIPARRTTAVIGPNGAGKTTLLLAILGLVPYTGSIDFNLFRKGRPSIGYVPQRLEFDRGLPCTVEDLMTDFDLPKGPLVGKKTKDQRPGSGRTGKGRGRGIKKSVYRQTLRRGVATGPCWLWPWRGILPSCF